MAVKQHLIGFIFSMFHALMTYVTRNMLVVPTQRIKLHSYTQVHLLVCLEILTPYQMKYLLLVQHNIHVRKWSIALLHHATW